MQKVILDTSEDGVTVYNAENGQYVCKVNRDTDSYEAITILLKALNIAIEERET
jgi:hypothetical protein